MTASIKSAMCAAAAVGCLLLHAPRADAQWWSRAPVDFEDCADRAEKAATKEARSAALSECNAKFAGRRKQGGGYTYYDFMQNRSFDIAGPNPTPQELKQIDEQYSAYLEREGQSRAAAAAVISRQRQMEVEQASLRDERTDTKTPAPVPAVKPRPATSDLRPRIKDDGCAKHSFSCDWPRLSEGIKDLKSLFGTSSGPSTSGASTSKARRDRPPLPPAPVPRAGLG